MMKPPEPVLSFVSSTRASRSVVCFLDARRGEVVFAQQRTAEIVGLEALAAALEVAWVAVRVQGREEGVDLEVVCLAFEVRKEPARAIGASAEAA